LRLPIAYRSQGQLYSGTIGESRNRWRRDWPGPARAGRQVLMRRTKAFTLIELLVVIAIIALLVSILLPSLHRAKRMATELVCATNVRNLTTTTTLYAMEYNGMFPYLYHRREPKPATGYVPWGQVGLQSATFGDWRDLLRDEYGVTGQGVFCPFNLQWAEKNGNAHETWDTAQAPDPPSGSSRHIIGYTFFFITWYDADGAGWSAEIDGVKFPTSMEDADYDEGVLWTDMTTIRNGNFFDLGKQRANHMYDNDFPAMLNAGYVDGHVEAKRGEDNMDGPHFRGSYGYWW
jgi:prepilin-type N-terminal cleavage/methylation domain-containing protein/prepilin-type processing-associated H-X9-DG protein